MVIQMSAMPTKGGKVGEIVKQGYLKRLKTLKKKYFVLRGDCGESPARLEYYESEKKFKANTPPKRTIILKTCFNINKLSHTRHKWVIGLHIKNDCFSIVMESEAEMEEWLQALLELQLGEKQEGEPVKPIFEHVWSVTVLDKELGGRFGIVGQYFLCLRDHSLCLVKESQDQTYETIEFSLQKIRRSGHSHSFFYMEVGQCTVTGAGNLWMQTEDPNIAENMHTTIYAACSNCSKNKDLQPKSRGRSSSANESSKPTNWIGRLSYALPTPASVPINHHRNIPNRLHPERRHSVAASSAESPHTGLGSSPSTPANSVTGGRERCDSLPSRARTTSEGQGQPIGLPRPALHHYRPPHPMYSKPTGPSPALSSPVSPHGCSTDSAGSSLSMDGDLDDPWADSHDSLRPPYPTYSLTPDEPVIFEEEGYPHWAGEDEKLNNYMPMDGLHTSLSNPKHSPNPPSSGFKSSSPSQGSYVDTCSPCGSSPLDTGYLPMSPAENRTLFGVRNGVCHSRGSSLAEDYVSMAPAPSDDGYVDMDHRSTRGSNCSITSGTPSTDNRFSDYPLDKVSTCIGEDVVPAERPARAYSLGSRPASAQRKLGVNPVPTTTAASDTTRARAFSVGSRTVNRVINRIRTNNPQPHVAAHVSSSHSSMEPTDDMMELDFTKKAKNNKNKAKKPSSVEKLVVPGSGGSLMELSPPHRSLGLAMPSPPKNVSSRLSYLLGRSPPKSGSPPVGGYPSPGLGRVPEAEPGYLVMDMRPARTAHYKRKGLGAEDNNNTKVVREAEDSGYVDMSLGDPSSDYMDMRPKEGRSQPITIQSKEARPFRASPPDAPPSFLPLESPPSGSVFPFSPGSPDHADDPYVNFQPGQPAAAPEEDDYLLMQPGPQPTLLSALATLSVSNTGSSNSGRELHYAALDLHRDPEESNNNMLAKTESLSSTSTPSPNPNPQASAFTYAEIDFAKCSKTSPVP